MRLLLTAAFCLCLPAQVWAQDTLLRADITEALVFVEGAEVTRSAPLDLPAGRHSLTIPMRDLGGRAVIGVTGPEGVRIGTPVELDTIAIPEGALDTPDQARARDALGAAEDAVLAAQDRLARRDAEIEGIEAQLAYLGALTRGEGGAAMPGDPAQLVEILTTLGTETARLGQALQAAREARRSDEAALEQARRAAEVAATALSDLDPFGPESRGLRIDLEAETAIDGNLAVSYIVNEVGWTPSHVLRLDTQADRLDITREVVLQNRSAASWRDVTVRFSTASPNRRRIPSEVAPDPVRLVPSAPEPEATSLFDGARAPAPVSLFAMESAPADLVIEGLSAVYDYAGPVSIGPTGEVTLPLDTLSLDVTLENRAVPRRDATAFLVAMGENASDAPLLPGPARFFRDGDLVGAGPLPLVPAGGEIEIGFGPLDHLRLFWQDLSLDEGERGVFVSETEQRRRIAFGVENTSTQPETVRLLYAAPFAEQEGLDLDVTFSPAPDATGVDDLRGVAAWDLDVAPGAEARIEMALDLSWREDMTLDWRP